jgi:hypothetical protein
LHSTAPKHANAASPESPHEDRYQATGVEPSRKQCFRSDQSGIFCGIFERKREQVKRVLKFTDPELAKRRRAIHRQKVERLTFTDPGGATNMPARFYRVDVTAP